MKANIILSQADFSQNNIGRFVELSELTEKVLTKQTQYSKSSVEAIALETFLSDLESEGFIGGSSPLLKSLFIPALASSHDELMFDVLNTDAEGYPINAMTENELTASEADRFYSVDRNTNGNVIGIKRNSRDDYDDALISTNMFEGYGQGDFVPSYSIILFVNNGMSETHPATLLVERYGWHSVIDNNSLDFTGKAVPYTNTHIAASITRSSAVQGFNGFSLNTAYGQQSWTGIVNNGTIGATETSGDYLNALKFGSEANGKYIIGHNYNLDSRRSRFGLLAFGKYIDTTKMVELKVLVDTLMTALHA